MNIEPFGIVVLWLGQVMPYLLICMAFAFMYAFLTNTQPHRRWPVAFSPAYSGMPPV